MTQDSPQQQLQASRRVRGELMLILTTVVWGATFAATKLLLETLHPMCLLAWRFGSAAILFLILFRKQLVGRFDRATLALGALLGLFLYGGFALQTTGLKYTTSSRSGFITTLYVVITPLLQTVLTRRLPARRVMWGILLVILGLWGLTSNTDSPADLLANWSNSGFGIGELLTLVAAAIFALYIIALDRRGRGLNPAKLTAAQLVTTGTLALAHSLIAREWTIPHGADSWMQLLYLSLFASVLATYWQTRYQGESNPTRAAIIYTMESVFAAIIGVIFLAEHLGPIAIAGGALIITGLLVVELKRGD
ncbi:MAG TPA: DMT family transporter [Candidatus Kapabacteria bacterium]|nr:DMT family transporter [Candidatus Kapabacteria bacterium]